MNSFSKLKNIQTNSSLKTKKNWKRYCQFFLGCLIVALSYNIFIASNDLVPGGVGGIAVIINNLFGVDNALVILVLNIFLLILSLILLGKESTKSTLLGSVLFPILVRLTEHANVWIQFDTSKILLMAIVGGIAFGTGAGLIFKAGFTTGGTDIINQIISKYGKISMGKSMLISDGLIVLCSGLFFGATSMLYSLLILNMISMMSDKIILGISSNKMIYIITTREQEIKDFIINDMHHGATIYKAKGGIDQKLKKVIMTVIPTKRVYELTDGIERIDKQAFYTITDSYELYGGE